MLYLAFIFFGSILILNGYASGKIIIDPYNTRIQKLRQFGFVWFLPIIGALVTLHILRSILGTLPLVKKNQMEFKDNLDSSLSEHNITEHSHHSID